MPNIGEQLVALNITVSAIKDTMEGVEEQVTKTNGRLRKLELFKSNVVHVTVAGLVVFVFMIVAATQGWVEAIVEFGK
jgi:uncharacterized protein YaaQ